MFDPRGAVPPHHRAIISSLLPICRLANVMGVRPCVLAIECGVEDRDKPVVPAYRSIHTQRRKEPFLMPLFRQSAQHAD